MRLVFYHVFSNAEILQRLRAEVNRTTRESPEQVELKTLEKLPFLTSVLMEGLRLSPALASRSQRIAPDRDLLYKNYRIPAGTPVGMTALLMHTDPALYPDPLRFDPDRWMDLEARKKAEKTWFPFSPGTRMCLGMQ
jgi:cytochrome P450